jgi:hypothetical protein
MVRKSLIIVLIVFAILSIVSRSAIAINCSFISPPSLIDEPNTSATAPVSVTLEWIQVTAAGSDPVQYYVQVSDTLDFSSPYNSGWISGTSSSSISVNLSDAFFLAGFDSGGNLIGLRWNVSITKYEFGLIDTTIGNFTVWGTVGDMAGWAPPVIISGNTLYVSGQTNTAQNKLYILDKTTGSLTSTVNLSDAFFLAGFDNEGNLIGLRWNVSASREEFGVINTSTGSFTFRGTVGDLTGFVSPAIISGNTLYVSGSNNSGQNRLYILDTTTGSLTSTVNLSDAFFLAGFDSGGNLIGLRWNVSASSEEFGVIDTTTGNFTVKGTVGDLTGFFSPAILSGNTLYATGQNNSSQNKLYILNRNTVSWALTLATNKTWYWRVQARDANHTDIVSQWSFDSFTIFQPPPAPTVIHTPDSYDYITLLWYPVTSPDGDPVQYYVQVDNDPNFGSPNYTRPYWEPNYSAGPYAGATVDYSELPAGHWCWRVRARDAAHTVLLSPWSAVDCFNFTTH